MYSFVGTLITVAIVVAILVLQNKTGIGTEFFERISLPGYLLAWILAISAFIFVRRMIIGFLVKPSQKRKERQERQEKIAKEIATAENTKKDLLQNMEWHISRAKKLASSLPGNIHRANESLDLAVDEYKEGAFAPFWDAVEKATFELATFNRKLQSIVESTNSYNTESQKYEGKPPEFELEISVIPDLAPSTYRLREVVRVAQKNFEFSTIYEQRKTNKILVAGFSSLGQAIHDLQTKISVSLDELGQQLSSAIEFSSENNVQSSLSILDELEKTRSHLTKESRDRRDHERRTEGMLDNLQRGRKPQF